MLWPTEGVGKRPEGVRAIWGATRCVGAKKICEIGVGFSFTRLVWIETRRVAKSEGRPWVDHCIEQCMKQCLKQCLAHRPEPRSGLCVELLGDFRIPNLLGARRGLRGQFSVQSE